MFGSTRRSFLQHSAFGLAAAGVSGLVLRCDAQPTQQVSRDSSDRILIQMGPPPREAATPGGELRKVTPQPYGPFYRAGAPFRGKLSLPGEPGTTFILSGRVWAYDTKRPLAGVVLDFWHVDMQEKYSNGVTDFRNRGRLVSSETGQYELESIRPVLLTFGAARTSISWPSRPATNRSSPRSTFKATRRRAIRCIVLRTRSPSKSAPSTAKFSKQEFST